MLNGLLSAFLLTEVFNSRLMLADSIRVYRRPRERFSNATVNEHDRYYGGFVIVWVDISNNGWNQHYANDEINEILQPVDLPFF